MIRHTSFAHGWFYHYRQHLAKTEQLCAKDFSSLGTYLDKMHTECPHEHFLDGHRSSKLRHPLSFKIHHVIGHEVSDLAKIGNSYEKGTPHTKVQKAMLEKDDKTIAVEVPLWMHAHEWDQFQRFFDAPKPLTGHIDALRIEDGRIWVWDYKPKAHKEKFATTQTYFYALMLSIRTGIPLEHFSCGYFDEQDTYIFKPQMEIVQEVIAYAR